MANVLVDEAVFPAIANSIRAKNGTEDTYKPSEMAGAIDNLPTSGGGKGTDAKTATWSQYSDMVQSINLSDFGVSGLTPERVIGFTFDYLYTSTGLAMNSVSFCCYKSNTGSTYTYEELTNNYLCATVSMSSSGNITARGIYNSATQGAYFKDITVVYI